MERGNNQCSPLGRTYRADIASVYARPSSAVVPALVAGTSRLVQLVQFAAHGVADKKYEDPIGKDSCVVRSSI